MQREPDPRASQHGAFEPAASVKQNAAAAAGPALPGSLRPTPLPADQPVEAVHGGVAGAPGASTPSPETRLYALGVAGVWAPVAGCTHTSAGCLVAIGCAGRAAMLSTADIAAATVDQAAGSNTRTLLKTIVDIPMLYEIRRKAAHRTPKLFEPAKDCIN